MGERSGVRGVPQHDRAARRVSSWVSVSAESGLRTPQAADAGLCPRARTSGASVRGRSRIGPLGPATLRKALALPAVVAMRANPALRAFAERLRAAGKCPKVVIVAVMRKLLELAWTLLRSGQPFSVSQGTRASTP